MQLHWFATNVNSSPLGQVMNEWSDIILYSTINLNEI